MPTEAAQKSPDTTVGHTPGPWMVTTSNSWRRIVSRDHSSVCEPITQNDGHPDLYFRNGGAEGPDARLISAAPVLLSELQMARQVLATACGEIAPYIKTALARIDAAINLAVAP